VRVWCAGWGGVAGAARYLPGAPGLWSAAKALKGARALDVQLCVGNKADSVPHHPAHAAPPPHPGEGALVALEEQRRGYMEWCLDRGFEYIEASAWTRASTRKQPP